MTIASAITSTTSNLPVWSSILLLVPAVAAAIAAALTQRRTTLAQSWKVARSATVVMIAAALASTALLVVTGSSSNEWLRTDTVGVVMGLLVSFIGWVIVRYSQTYLAGDPKEQSYIDRLLTTLSAVGIVVVANHLIVLVLAWTATSVALHRLLTFYGDRSVAVAVAHKKFLLARAADLCMVGAVVAFGTTFSTLRIDGIASAATSAATMPAGARVGILLVAAAALLKCAQLPFHGWLIQVMEAPTPVSALLHAGIVNLGGFVLLRFAPVVDRAVETRVLLVTVGATTGVLAALVMTTRISVKVSLAWSTCAQMGFMVMQCGLGLWAVALLHLVAHSLYKAHAFLGAGGVVRQTQRNRLHPKPAKPNVARIVAGFGLAAAATLAAGLVSMLLPFSEHPSAAMWVVGGIVAAALVPLVMNTQTTLNPRAGVREVTTAFSLALAYFCLHALIETRVADGSTPPMALIVAVALAFSALFAVQTLGSVFPAATWSRRLYPWFYGGLFLDEAFTRSVFRLWPPPTIKAEPNALPHRGARATVFPVGPRPANTAAPLLLDGSIA